MKMWKRTLTSIFRKPAQSILMFLIIFLLGNILFASIAIKQTSENVRLEMRARVPSYMTIRATTDNQSKTNKEKIEKIAQELTNNENVKSLKTIRMAQIISVEINDENSPYYDEDQPYDWNHNFYLLLNNVDDSMFEYEMIEGRYYTQEELDKGSQVIVLSDHHRTIYGYDENGKSTFHKLKVGDKVKINLNNYKIVKKEYSKDNYIMYTDTDVDNLIPYEFEIIGVYQGRDYKADSKDFEKTNQYYDPIEIPSKCYDQMNALQEEVFDNHSDEDKKHYDLGQNDFYRGTTWIERIKMTTKGLDAAEELEKQLLENPDYPKSYFAIDSSNEDYIYIQAPLENLDALANVALWASVVLIVVLMNLVSILFIRNRTKEIGVLISMGERKLKVLGQFVGEILIVGLLATSCSMVTGSYFGDAVSQKFMEIQIDADYEMQYQEENPDAVTQLDLLDTYKVELDGTYIASIYGASAIILALSSALPMIYILKMKPKKVLM